MVEFVSARYTVPFAGSTAMDCASGTERTSGVLRLDLRNTSTAPPLTIYKSCVSGSTATLEPVTPAIGTPARVRPASSLRRSPGITKQNPVHLVSVKIYTRRACTGSAITPTAVVKRHPLPHGPFTG